MISAISILTLGFVLGMRHATDADHVVAVATIVSRHRMVKMAAWVGALWGLGHTLTIVAVGVPIIVFNWVVAPRVGLAMELVVGLMLILLGLRNLAGFNRCTDGVPTGQGENAVVHVHPHAHGDSIHAHPHGHAPESRHPHRPQDTSLGRLDRVFGGLGIYQAARPIVVGVVHGLAGSAAVALLVLTTIRDPTWAVGYLLVFGMGTVVGMALITTAIALPFAGAVAGSAHTHRRLRVLTGLLSFCFGVFLVYRIGILDGLFSAAPRWIPQ